MSKVIRIPKPDSQTRERYSKRQGQKPVMYYLPIGHVEALRTLAYEQRTSQTELVRQSIELLCDHYGKDIAPSEEERLLYERLKEKFDK